MFSALHWIEKTLMISIITVVLGSLLSVGIHYYLLYREVKDLRSFKAQTQAMAKLKIQENTLIEQNNEKKLNQSTEAKVKRNNIIVDNFKWLHDADSASSASLSKMSSATTGMPNRPSYEELAKWYSELVDQFLQLRASCREQTEACAMTTNQLNCINDLYR